MRFTKELLKRPHRCVYYPQIGSGHERGFVVSDIPFDAWDSRLQPAISVVALEEIADKIPEAGLARRDELTQAQAELEQLKRENEDLREQMTQYDKELDAITVLKARGYKPTQKPGRKPAAKAA